MAKIRGSPAKMAGKEMTHLFKVGGFAGTTRVRNVSIGSARCNGDSIVFGSGININMGAGAA